MATPETIPFTLTGADGKPTEVQIPRDAIVEALKDTHLPKDRVDQELDRRIKAFVKNQGLRKAEELLDDEAFVTQVLEKHGKKGAEADAATSEALKAALKRQADEFDVKTVKPLNEKLTKLQENEEKLLIKDLERQIIVAAQGRAKEPMLKSPGKGKAAPIISMLRDVFGYDEDSGEFYVTDGDHFALSTSEDKNQTYQGVQEFVDAWLADPANVDFVKPGQTGAGVGGGTGGGKGGARTAGEVVLTPEQAGNAAEYRKALEKVGGDHSKIRVERPAKRFF